MLIGKYYHNLETKGRLSLPKKFRELATDWVVTRGLDGCLFMFKQDKFEEKINQIAKRTFTKKAHRDLVRLMTNEAQELKADKTGRVNLPNYLIEFANLSKNIVVVGSLDYLEIWDQENYHSYIDQIEQSAEEISERINDSN